MKTTIRHILSTLALAAISATAQAQIGYQVSLLNTATGEPRANVTVNAQVTITDSQDNTIYSGSQRATTNDFGVLSLAVGDANTFANADTGKMPFFISVSVDGTLIGRSQILNVPVAEVANKLKSSFTKEDLVGTWVYKYEDPVYDDDYTQYYKFSQNGTFVSEYLGPKGDDSSLGEFEIAGNDIHLYYYSKGKETLRWYKSRIYPNDGQAYKKQE